MQEYTIRGTIITEAVSTRNIESGTVCLMKKDETYHCITITHIDARSGNWMVEGDYVGPCNKETPLLRLSVLTTDNCYSIGFKDWKRIIRANLVGTTNHTFLVKPKQFRPGKYVQTCSECHGTFLAAKSQPHCKSCCHKLATAYLHGDSKQKTEGIKYSRKFVETLCAKSYAMGQENVAPETFTNRLKILLDNGNYLNPEEN